MSTTGSSNYTVKSGDTLSAIATAHGVSLQSLKAANPQISNPNVIYPGQSINIPGGGSAAPVKPAPSSNGSSNVARTAESFKDQWAENLKRSGKLPMNPDCDSTECCANFVSAVLVKTGQLPSNMQTTWVVDLESNLKTEGWKPVDKAHAKPGDVVIVNIPGGQQHTEIVASNNNGQITLIGSNNTGDGTGPQKVGYDSHTANNMACTIYTPPK